MEKIRTRQEVKEEMTFIEAWKVYGFIETLDIKYPGSVHILGSFFYWSAIVLSIISIFSPLIKKVLAKMI